MTVSWRRCVLIYTEDSLRVMEKISKARQSTQAGWEADLVERLGYDGRVVITRDVACQSRQLRSLACQAPAPSTVLVLRYPLRKLMSSDIYPVSPPKQWPVIFALHNF